MSNDILNLLAPAFCMGILVSLPHIVLGQEVLRRGIIFLDLAVAQCAALGMISFGLLSFIDPYSFIGHYGPILSGLALALLCAFLFKTLDKLHAQHQEALIGCTFVLTASLSIIAVTNAPHGAEDIKNLLAGQILWTEWSDIKLALPVFTLVFLLWQFLPIFRSHLFFPLFAITIPFSVHFIGIYLVFASLIFPALALINQQRHKTTTGIGLSTTSFALGLSLSAAFDWPSGPSIVLALALISGLYFLIKRTTDQNYKA